jgi:hypothetical protein
MNQPRRDSRKKLRMVPSDASSSSSASSSPPRDTSSPNQNSSLPSTESAETRPEDRQKATFVDQSIRLLMALHRRYGDKISPSVAARRLAQPRYVRSDSRHNGSGYRDLEEEYDSECSCSSGATDCGTSDPPKYYMCKRHHAKRPSNWSKTKMKDYEPTPVWK